MYALLFLFVSKKKKAISQDESIEVAPIQVQWFAIIMTQSQPFCQIEEKEPKQEKKNQKKPKTKNLNALAQ